MEKRKKPYKLFKKRNNIHMIYVIAHSLLSHFLLEFAVRSSKFKPNVGYKQLKQAEL